MFADIGRILPRQHSFSPLHAIPDDVTVCSINNKYYTGATIYIRAINIERDGEQYGTYYQAVRSYREQGKVKQEIIHFGDQSKAKGSR